MSLDKIYISPDEENICFLDCTRVNGKTEMVSRRGESLEDQIIRLSNKFKNKEIILADDVVFSGSVLRNIISKFNLYGVKVVLVIASVCTNESYNYFKSNLKYGIKTNYIMLDDVIDQVCERDFYFGIAGSGIMIETESGLYKAPYFKPYGNSYERASIPAEYENFFSKGCLDRSLYLWNEIDNLKKAKTKILELPEKIIYTNENEEVCKTLKKELKRI